MICSVFKPSRQLNGKSVRRRLWWGQYRLDGDTAITRVPLKTFDKQIAKERLTKLVKTLQQEREGMIAPGPMREAGGMSVPELCARYTGLRRSEMDALQWGDIRLDEEKPFIVARAATTKNRQEAKLWIRPELLAILKDMRPADASADQPVFRAVLDVAGGHKIRRFQRDLKAAGIPYRDAQGRTADFHALSRMTPNTHMGQMGVGERVRQEFMRHSDLRLTSAVYTDAGQLPTAGAILALPSFSADGSKTCAQRGAQSPDNEGQTLASPCTIDYSI